MPCLSGLDWYQFVASSARFFLALGTPCSSGSNLQQLGEEKTPNKNAKNALMDVKEKEAILATAKALNGEDVPT